MLALEGLKHLLDSFLGLRPDGRLLRPVSGKSGRAKQWVREAIMAIR